MAHRKYPQLYDRKWMQSRIDAGASGKDIAREVGCTPTAVWMAGKKIGVRFTHHKPSLLRYPQLRDAAYLRQRYITEGSTAKQIAAEVGCSLSHVQRAIERHGLTWQRW